MATRLAVGAPDNALRPRSLRGQGGVADFQLERASAAVTGGANPSLVGSRHSSLTCFSVAHGASQSLYRVSIR